MTSSQTVLPIAPARPQAAARAAALAYSPRLSPGLLAVVAGLHALVLGLLVFKPDAPEPVTPPRPLTVSLIQPDAPEPQPEPRPQPKPKPPPPKPVMKPLPPPPVLVAERPLPTPAPVVEAPKPAPVPEPVPEVLPPPAPPVVVEAPRPAPPPPPAPPTPPRPADYLNNPKPLYPALSRRLREEGVVRLNILVDPDGSVARLEIAKSSGYPRLDEAAAKTVRSSWKFEPARQGGKPIQAWVIVPIEFTLRS
jgi:protein TonB